MAAEVAEIIEAGERLLHGWDGMAAEGSLGIPVAWDEPDGTVVALIYYECGGLRVEHSLGHDKKKRLYEGVVAVEAEERTPFIDRVLNYVPLSRGELLADHGLLYRQLVSGAGMLRGDGTRTHHKGEILVHHLFLQMVKAQENPAQFRKIVKGLEFCQVGCIPVRVVSGGLFGVGRVNRRR